MSIKIVLWKVPKIYDGQATTTTQRGPIVASLPSTVSRSVCRLAAIDHYSLLFCSPHALHRYEKLVRQVWRHVTRTQQTAQVTVHFFPVLIVGVGDGNGVRVGDGDGTRVRN